jgi:hypothetical protein
LFDTTGTPDGRSQIDGEVLQHPGIQLRVRASGHQTGWSKINSLTVALDAINNYRVTIDSSTYTIQVISRRSTVESIGKEDSVTKRDRFVANFTVSIDQEG